MAAAGGAAAGLAAAAGSRVITRVLPVEGHGTGRMFNRRNQPRLLGGRVNRRTAVSARLGYRWKVSVRCRRVSTSVKIAQGTTVVATNTAEADDPDPALLLESPCDLHFRYARAYVRLSV